MTPSQLAKVLLTGIPLHHTFLIISPPGIGKTQIGKQCSYAANFECQVFHPAISDPTDFKGMPWIYVPKESSAPSAEFIPFGDIRRLLECKVPTTAFLDDFGQAPSSVQAAAMQLLWGGELNGRKFPDYITWLVASNRREDRAAVTGILEPVKSRCFSIINLVPDVEDWILWAIAADVPVVIRAFIRNRPELLSAFKPSADIQNCPLPRTWYYVGELVKAQYPREVKLELYQGAVGEGAGNEFFGYEDVFMKLPNPKSIINDPDNAEIPDDPAVLYALTGALANLAADDTIGSICKYGQRLWDNHKAEFSTVMIRDCESIRPEVMETREYIEWRSVHPEI